MYEEQNRLVKATPLILLIGNRTGQGRKCTKVSSCSSIEIGGRKDSKEVKIIRKEL
jgi:hypothetical protein